MKGINKIIEASIREGMPIRCEYVLDRGWVYEANGFYKSHLISIEENEKGILIATARYGEKTEINDPVDIVQLNYDWWIYSKDKFSGWAFPDSAWGAFFTKYGFDF